MARVLGCPVATVLRIDIATKMKMCLIRNENVVKVSAEPHKEFFDLLYLDHLLLEP
jgi:hypothetical protein